MRDWVPLMAQMSFARQWWSSINRTVACSETIRARLVEGGFRDVEVIPYGIRGQLARPPLSDPPTVLFAGRLVREKGTHILLEAFRNVVEGIPAARLEIAGDGPEAGIVREQARQAGIADRVTFHGWLSSDDLDGLYRRAWVQAVPSLFEEPLGMVAVEAAVRGVPAVVSDTGGLAEIVVEGETGCRVPRNDVDALAAALERFLGHRDEAERMGANARARALERFSLDTYVDRFRDLYERVQS
jgi:glycosyltransferase involved in cell wall biosynthesis